MSNFVSSGLTTIPFSQLITGSFSVKISGVQYFCVAGSLKIDLSVGRRSQASFVLHTNTATHFQQYQQVSIYDSNGLLVFSGYITNPKEQKPGWSDSLIQTITCTDQHYLADKRLISKIYANMTVGSIVQDILTTILAAEGVTGGVSPAASTTQTTTTISDGLIPSLTLYPSTTLYPNGNIGVVSSTTFNTVTVASALDSLVTAASSAGEQYYWAIDMNKKLFFQPYSANKNNTIVDGSWINQATNGATVQRQNPKYRNTQWLTKVIGQTQQLTQTVTSDGQSTAWAMGYPLDSAPTVSVNGVGQSVGVKGTTGSTFYWAQGDPAIVQDSAAARIPPSQKLIFTYIGQYPTTVTVQNTSQIAAQKAIDGTSGIVEVVDDTTSVTGIASATTLGSSYLNQYAVSGVMLQFDTMIAGFQPGQLVTVNLPMHKLNSAQMLIESVTAADSDGVNIWYTVNCILGPYDTTWVSFFSKLINTPSTTSAPITAGTVVSITGAPSPLTPNNATVRLGISSGPQPPTHKQRDASARFLQRVSGTLTTTSQTFTAAFSPAPSATLAASVVAGSTGGGTGGGSGLLQLYSFGDNTNTDPDNLANNKYCAGVNILLYWTQLEPSSEGNFDWAPMETPLNHWAAKGKKCIVRISVSGQNSSSWHLPYSAQGTPSWVFSAGVQKITGGGNTIVPQYWSSAFQTKMGAFIQAVANKYDGDSRIAGFQIAVGMGGECKTDSTKITNKLQIMQAAGYTDALWFKYIQFVMNAYQTAFKKSQLMMASDTDVIGKTTGYSQDTTIGYITAQNGKIWIQNDGLVVGQSIRKSLVDAFSKIPVVSEQRNAVLKGTNSAASGDTMAQDLAIAKTQATSKIFLVFSQDIANSSNNSTFDQYVQTF